MTKTKATTLQQYFPLIRTREEVLNEIQENKKLYYTYLDWSDEERNYFLDFCTGMKGVKVLYDSFFKTVMNPDATPERIERFLSAILKQPVKLLKVLPTNDSRIADEGSLLIMDILVELADGSLANIECQKIGYEFPGERAACYSADLLLRQYVRIKGERGKDFTYRDIKSVYTIIFFEKSQEIFKEFQEDYIHHFRQVSDTGLHINLLQEFILIPLDIFRKIRQNKCIETMNQLEAWLTFFSTDRPEEIIELIEHFPEFQPLYEDVYAQCRNIEEVMGVYSKELRELDRNTVQYMIERLQKELDKKKSETTEMSETLTIKEQQISKIATARDEAVAERDEAVAERDEAVAEIARLKQLLKNNKVDI